MSNLIEDYEQAASTPIVPYWVQLVASLAMSGLKIMPSRLAQKAGEGLRKVWDCDEIADGEKDFYEGIGFVFAENHCRSSPHELWQHDLGEENKGAWIMPIDEIIAITYADPQACDYVSIQRLLFEGTEKELETAIDKIGPAVKDW